MTTTVSSAVGVRPQSNRLARFASLLAQASDPLGYEAGDTNLNRYVGNGPTVLTDPYGLQAVVPTNRPEITIQEDGQVHFGQNVTRIKVDSSSIKDPQDRKKWEETVREDLEKLARLKCTRTMLFSMGKTTGTGKFVTIQPSGN